jgi:hypothetical protein
MEGRRVIHFGKSISTFGIIILFFMVFSLPILVGDAKESKATEQRIEGQQPRKSQSLPVGFRATKIVDAVVKNDRGEEVGEVDDLIISQNGKVMKPSPDQSRQG